MMIKTQLNQKFWRTLFMVCALLTLEYALKGQDNLDNLISNPSLDSIEKCTDNQFYISNGTVLMDWWHWLKGSPGTGVFGHYFNTCHEELMNGILTSTGVRAQFEPILPRSGSGYYFLIPKQRKVPDHNLNISPDQDTIIHRMFLKNRLNEALVEDSTYVFLFFKRGVRWIPNNSNNYTIHNCASPALAAYFSVDSNSVGTGATTRETLFSIKPQIQWNEYNLDTTHWTLMAGCFTAKGGERFMTLGRFNKESESDLEDCQDYVVSNNIDTLFLENQTERMFVDDFGLYDMSTFTFADQDHCLTDTFFFRDPYDLGFMATYDGDTLNKGWVPPGPGSYKINISLGLCQLDKTFQLEVTPCSVCLPELSPIELCPDDSYFNPADYIDPGLQVKDTIIALCPGSYEFPVFHPHCSTPFDILEIEVVDYPECHNNLPLDIQCVGTELQLPEGDHYSLDVGGAYIPSVWTEPTEIPYQFFDNFCDIEIESGTMRVIECEDCDIFIPNVFSPNGDGINDYFEISTACHVQSAKIQIFDRYGTLIHESRHLDRIWDGGQKSTGVYVYRAHIEHSVADGTQTRIFAGTVTLAR